MLLAISVVRPLPICTSPPEPLIVPSKGWIVLEIEHQSVIVGHVALGTLPVVPPLPNCRVPAEIVVPPV